MYVYPLSGTNKQQLKVSFLLILANDIRKFGKQIQKKQLDIPEYAASFVDYKALKKLIKELRNSPVTRPGLLADHGAQIQSPQLALQANKAPFFFRLDRELDKVNSFYTVKESESKVRLRVLIDKQRSMRMRHPSISKNSTHYATLEQGLRDFIKDLSKLQQFIEINATAFSKILKKWDKTSKSQTKELYLSRAIEVQPVFNRDVISELSDQASTSLLDCAAWAEGEGTQYGSNASHQASLATPRLEQVEADGDLLDALYRGDIRSLQDLLKRFDASTAARDRITRAFLTAVSEAPEDALELLLSTGLVELGRQDEINDRNCLHKAAMSGRRAFLQAALRAHVDLLLPDAYGRVPLHYASMNGHSRLLDDLIRARPDSVDTLDLDDFTPLIHAINNGHLVCVERLLSYSAHVNPVKKDSHIPLNLACQHDSVAVVELLLRSNPIIMPDAEGLFPQHLVARCGAEPALLLLLRDYGADLDQPDKLYQWTPLFHAASEGRIACLQTLLEGGVRTETTDEKGQSALYYATWEGHLHCMALLASVMTAPNAEPMRGTGQPFETGPKMQLTTTASSSVEQIPDLSLPPPIIPTRRYGHNFLDSKTTVMLIFGEGGKHAVTFYDESKYPAARLTIAPRSSDILARNILLPVQDDNRGVSFETTELSNFAVDFDVYPTFGKKVLARGSIPPEVFGGRGSSSGYHYLSLLDPRLRTVGQLHFKFQVIKPFHGLGLDITSFATYWKATSQLESKPSSFVTGSSLSGDYVKLYVQMTLDGVPVVFPHWTIDRVGLELPILRLTYEQFTTLGSQTSGYAECETRVRQSTKDSDMASLHSALSESYRSLEDVLAALPSSINVNIHVLYPSEEQEEKLHLSPTPNINDFVDGLLKVVFEQARTSREQSGSPMRSLAFSSYNTELCTALNWKQPNYPVLLCNDLAADLPSPGLQPSSTQAISPTSIKEAVRIATTNNFMGLICRSRLLDTVPALIEAIKVAGLVLVSDASTQADDQTSGNLREGIDGVLRSDGILWFKKVLDV